MATSGAISAPLPDEQELRIQRIAHELTNRHCLLFVRSLVEGLMKLKSGTKKDHEAYGFRKILEQEHGDLLDEIEEAVEWRNYPPLLDPVDLQRQYKSDYEIWRNDAMLVEEYPNFADYLVGENICDRDQIEDYPSEIYWYLVSDWAQGQLEERGEIVADVGPLTLWGRTGGGQLTEADACWRDMAMQQIREEDEAEAYYKGLRDARNQPAAE